MCGYGRHRVLLQEPSRLLLALLVLILAAGKIPQALTRIVLDSPAASLPGKAAVIHGPAGSQYLPRLPAGVDGWQYMQIRNDSDSAVLQQPAEGTYQRFWSEGQLAEAIWSSGLPQFKPLLDRLNRGLSINVVAWGSSVVQDHAGCFHPSLGHVKQLVRQLPLAYRVPYICTHYQNGWLHNFMQVLNTTWPHANHTLVNAGRGGQSLMFFLRSCAEDEVPQRVDLWVLENMDGRSSGEHMEALVWSVLRMAATRGHPRPAIVLINSAASADDYQSLACMRNATMCDTACGPASDGTPGFRNAITGAAHRERHNDKQHAATQLGHYYGVTVLSHAQFLASMLRDGVHTAHGWSECMFLTRMHMDEIHPNALGRVLWADYLLAVMRLAERHAAEQPTMPPPGLPTEPLFPGGHDVLLHRCYMADDDLYDTPGGDFMQLQVVQNTGWEVVEYYNNSQGRLVYKPGIMASLPGSVLAVRVDPVFPSGAAREGSTRAQVAFLKSWDRMGIVHATCEGDCKCYAMDLDGAHSERTSVAIALDMRLLEVGPDCVLRFEVAAATRSDGHRFKLINVVVSALPTQQAEFSFPPWEGFGDADHLRRKEMQVASGRNGPSWRL